MEKYLSIINQRTFGILAISLVSTLLIYHFSFTYDLDLTLISIAIVFPLVFTIRSAFKRRDRALEYLSRFRSGLVSVDFSFLSIKKLSKEDKTTIHQQILTTSKAMMDFLDGSIGTLDELRAEASKINQFILDKADLIKPSNRLKIINQLYNVHMGIETVASIKQYNTPKSMRAYCLIFIYLYPIMCTPSIYFKLQQGVHEGNLYLLIFLSLTSSFILISLFNVQEQLENPFDRKGLDDIHAETFAFKTHIN
ncbi:hypothetical protein D0X99_15800 [Algoriphagus lacus]|mgnify:CR=1 FL=1|uniref:DUF4239 domain-containing protein n=1 Tax=Algoriphagus lacus TaxID=2056311 RepID=A0A418PP43_9BACT|nr:hypothetical protein [Algoriphagus lacus]RIW13703.1 hypothetical protein D0X99_15800 [Algoriphagus lacus]